jgi:hypothetical protein
MSGESRVRDAFADQAQWCAKLGSPLTARLMEVMGPRLDRCTASGRKILDWQGQPNAHGDSVPLRLAGALHALVRRGRLPDLARRYPPNALPEPEDLAAAAFAALADADAEIAEWLDHPPQTNEVGRSGILYPGMMVLAKETGLPLSLFEIGCSAGLNLIPDRYAYRLGRTDGGAQGSPVALAPAWTGPAPDGVDPVIAARRGCDRSPLHVTDPAHHERLIAYIWPDQADRLARVEAAIGLARADPPAIDRADAADWVDEMIGAEPRPGMTRVLFHSIAFQYFPEAAQRRIAATMERAGRTATPDTPLAWLAFEHYRKEAPRLTLRLWPGGGERELARGDAHVHTVNWLAPV